MESDSNKKSITNDSGEVPSRWSLQVLATRLFGKRGESDSINWRLWLLNAVAVAFLILIIYAASASVGLQYLQVLRNIAAAILVAAAAAAVGGILGFLFGIPRSLQREQNSGEPFQSVRTNTNLEQISDWLTKIIVGVGLVQAGKIVLLVEDMATKIAPLFAASENAAGRSGSAFVLVLMILFSILGFLVGYLWARIYLQETFNDMEERARRQPEYFEGLMNSYLYMTPPRGFNEALKLLEQYKKSYNNDLTDRMWTYLVCALGQQYAYKVEVEKLPEEKLKEDKEKLMETLRTALRRDSEARSLLRLELEPDGRVPDELFEGDLRCFGKDDVVKGLLRKDPMSPKPPCG